jgi:hypothetical protein
MSLTPIAWKIYYGDGAIRTSLDSWETCEGDDVQCVIVYFAETYQTYVSADQTFRTENYREILHGKDYYWFDAEANRPFTGMAEDAVGKTDIKCGRTMPSERFVEIYNRARRDKRWE